MKKPAAFRLMLITDERRSLGRDEAEIAARAVSAGVDAVQYRPLSGTFEARLQTARRLRDVCKGRALFLVNGDAALALAAEADGVHCGAKDDPVAEIRRRIGGSAILGYSAHGIEEALRAAEEGADYVTFSPIFETSSHYMNGPPQGLARLEEAVRKIPVPVVALGGIGENNIVSIAAAGCGAAAIVSAITEVEDVEAAVRRLLTAFSGACG